MCYYVLQETLCGVPECGCIFFAIVYRGLCNKPKEPSNSTDLCRGGNAFWFWAQGPLSSTGNRPQGCCSSCQGPDYVELMTPRINIQTAPKVEGWPKESYEDENGWITEVPSNKPTGSDLDSFARHKLAYQKACFGGLPGMSWVWHDQIDQADVDREVDNIHQSVRTGDFLRANEENGQACPILEQIDELDNMFEPTVFRHEEEGAVELMPIRRLNQNAAERGDEETVDYDADTPAVQ